jgi:hypothetical protein
MERARDDDPELNELREVMAQWNLHVGLNVDGSAKALVQDAERRRYDEDTGRPLPDYANPELRDALLAIAGIRLPLHAE